jgi:hypothetical protein
MLGRQRQADQTATVTGHEVDGFRRHFLGGQGKIPLVLAVLVIDDDDDLAVANIFQCFPYRMESHRSLPDIRLFLRFRRRIALD